MNNDDVVVVAEVKCEKRHGEKYFFSAHFNFTRFFVELYIA
jgi:hypothetical protein